MPNLKAPVSNIGRKIRARPSASWPKAKSFVVAERPGEFTSKARKKAKEGLIRIGAGRNSTGEGEEPLVPRKRRNRISKEMEKHIRLRVARENMRNGVALQQRYVRKIEEDFLRDAELLLKVNPDCLGKHGKGMLFLWRESVLRDLAENRGLSGKEKAGLSKQFLLWYMRINAWKLRTLLGERSYEYFEFMREVFEDVTGELDGGIKAGLV